MPIAPIDGIGIHGINTSKGTQTKPIVENATSTYLSLYPIPRHTLISNSR